nr:hypothetical protein [uncultured Bacteroides sp.]
MKKSTVKKLLIALGVIIFTPIIVSLFLVLTSDDITEVMKERTDNLVEWRTMSSEQKQKSLEDMISDKDFNHYSDLNDEIEKAINDEVHSEAVFRIEPSVYNGFSNVVEPDSGWIYTIFKGSFRNPKNEKIAISGDVMFIYKPKDKSLSVKKWNINYTN